ncbi:MULTISPECIES: S8 family serine peptidase [unclassified Luteimonas]
MTSNIRNTTTTALAVAITAALFAAPSYAALKSPASDSVDASRISASRVAPPQRAAVKKPVFGKPAQAYGANLKAPADDSYREFIVSFQKGAKPAADLQRQLDAVGKLIGARINIERTLGTGAQLIRLDREIDVVARKQLEGVLMQRSDIRAVEPNGFAHRLFEPNDPLFPQQWHYQPGPMGMNAVEAWDTYDGTGSIVAVLDTGQVEHEDLTGQFIAGYDFITDPENARDGDGRDADPNDEGDWDSKYDSSWHGTHVAGTIAALTDNNIGGAGVAHGAKVQHVRVLGNLGGAWTDVSDAIIWASGGTVDGVPDNATPADVINLSLGGGVACQTFMQDAIDIAVGNGTTVVIAAGNSNSDVGNFSPASCNGAMAIAGTGPDNTKYSASNYGLGISVAAPAGAGSGFPETSQVLSTINLGTTVQAGDGYAWYAGTSMAAPHVAGTIALMLEAAEGDLGPTEIETILQNTGYASNGTVTNCDTSSRWCAWLIDARYAAAVAAGNEDLPPTPPGPPPPPPPVELENGVTVELGSMTATSEKFYVLNVPEGASPLTFAMAPGTDATGDSDLYVRFGSAPTDSDYDCRPWTGGVVAEDCNFTSPAAGEWHVRIVAYSASSGYSLTGTYGDDPPPPPPPGAVELENGVTVTGIDVGTTEQAMFYIDVPEGATDLSFDMSGGTGDADLYVLMGQEPTDTNWNCRPWDVGNEETCSYPTPDAGRWYARIYGYEAATGVTLTASFVDVGGGVAPQDLAARHVFPLKGQRIRTQLEWVGGEGEQVDVKFNGEVAATAVNSGLFTHTFTAASTGAGSATYQVCNAGTTECSETITVNYSARR